MIPLPKRAALAAAIDRRAGRPHGPNATVTSTIDEDQHLLTLPATPRTTSFSAA